MLFGSIFFYYWTANLISYLTTKIIILPFNGIDSLLSDTNYKIAVDPGSAYQSEFQYSTDPVWKKAWTNRVKPHLDDYKSYYKNGYIYF